MVSGPRTFFKQWIYGKVNSPSVFGSVSPGLLFPYLLFSLLSICKSHLHRASRAAWGRGSASSAVTHGQCCPSCLWCLMDTGPVLYALRILQVPQQSRSVHRGEVNCLHGCLFFQLAFPNKSHLVEKKGGRSGWVLFDSPAVGLTDKAIWCSSVIQSEEGLALHLSVKQLSRVPWLYLPDGYSAQGDYQMTFFFF